MSAEEGQANVAAYGDDDDSGKTHCRSVRSHYAALHSRICEDKDEIASVDSGKFKTIMFQVEELHLSVKRPREQVADAEALLELANSLVACVKSHAISGITTSEFISCLLRDFELRGRQAEKPGNTNSSVDWKDIGRFVSPIFRTGKGCMTMLGAMTIELKQRKVVSRQRTKTTASARPEELDDRAEKKTDTDKNIFVMFEILRKEKVVKLESLVLNRKSFAQTVENLFALSFLVKDGRVEVSVDEKGSHSVSPKNAPDANRIMSGEDKYRHFVFRFDFSDWKMMKEMVAEGAELMPHRETPMSNSCKFQAASVSKEPCVASDATPVKTLYRKRGSFLHEKSDHADSEDNYWASGGNRSCKRKLL